MRFAWLAFVAITAAAQDYVPAQPVQQLAPAVARITAANAGAHIAYLASPALEGRGLGTRGLDAAVEYVAANLKLAGLEPFGQDGSYFQRVPLLQHRNWKGQLQFASPSKKPTTSVSADKQTTARNVLAIIRGADPQLRGEAVIVGAHLDHLGRVRGAIIPGADDNASGVSAVLEIARAFAASSAQPRRTVIFAFWTGEEKGHFGSEHYVSAPLWPLEKTIAYVNLDTIGTAWKEEDVRKLVAEDKPANADAFLATLKAERLVEPGIPRNVPRLESALLDGARATGMSLRLDWTDGKGGGSDYRAFARAGVPFIRLFGNYTLNYHKPTDTAANLDSAQVERVARFAFVTAWRLAQE